MPVIYSVIIPAYNEENYLRGTLVQLQESMDKVEAQGEIIVVDNNSTDRTAEIAGEFGVKLVFEAVNQISRARNSGARMAAGRYLVFLDADTRLVDDLLRRALDNLQGGDCCGGGAAVRFERAMPWLTQAVLDFWNWYSTKRSIAAGCFIYCLREGFEAVGGFSEAVYASEEIWFSRAMKAWGRKNKMNFRIIEDHPIITSVRKLEWYTAQQIFIHSLPFLIFPPLLRVQYFCRQWYRRPGN